VVLADLPPRLEWADDSEPGIRRRKAGTGFSYRTDRGGRVDATTRDRIRKLAIPPAWTDVWICRSPHGHLQATGRDARGRKQYRYHPDYRAHRDEAKFDRMTEFGKALAPIRKQVTADLALGGMPKEKVAAVVVRLLDETLARVGNEEYARSNGSYGLTTLRDKHAKFTPSGLRLVFPSKHDIRTDVAVSDKRIRSIVRRCQDLPGQCLFQYVGDGGDPHPISSTDVNEYLQTISGEPVTAKDFRTWKATTFAAEELADLPPPESERAARSEMARVVEAVAAELRNTPAVCRRAYIHPGLFESYRQGEFTDLWYSASGRGSPLLTVEERRLLRVLPHLEAHPAAA
jgi:DNA topoisomerase-1